MLQFNLHSDICQQITTRIVQNSAMTILTIFTFMLTHVEY